MPDVHDLFPEIEKLDGAQLHARYNELKAKLPPNPKDADDASVHEMVCILGALRRKSVGPPKAGTTKGPKVEPTIEDL